MDMDRNIKFDEIGYSSENLFSLSSGEVFGNPIQDGSFKGRTYDDPPHRVSNPVLPKQDCLAMASEIGSAFL